MASFDESTPVPSVTRVRLGLATNSSSSHSLVLLSSTQPEDEQTRGEYQWEYFTLVTQAAKRHYLAAMLVSGAPGLYGLPATWRETLAAGRSGTALDPQRRQEFEHLEERWPAVVADVTRLCGLPGDTDLLDYWVNHQSVYAFEPAAGGWGPDPDDFARYRDLLLVGGVAVLGGNDNSGPHPLWEAEDEHLHLGSTDSPFAPTLRGED